MYCINFRTFSKTLSREQRNAFPTLQNGLPIKDYFTMAKNNKINKQWTSHPCSWDVPADRVIFTFNELVYVVLNHIGIWLKLIKLIFFFPSCSSLFRLHQAIYNLSPRKSQVVSCLISAIWRTFRWCVVLSDTTSMQEKSRLKLTY